MTSRERVLAAARHVQPDRVPIGVNFSATLEQKLQDSSFAFADRLRFGVEQGATRLSARREWVGGDLVRVGPQFKNPASPLRYADPTVEVTGEGHLLDIWRVPFKEVQAGQENYVDLVGRPPLAHCDSVAQLDAFPWPSADDWDYSQIPADLAAAGTKAAWGHSRGFFEIAHFMRGMENFLTDLAQNSAFAGRLMDHILEFLMERSRRILRAGKGQFTFFEYNDDVGSQRGLFISPAMWRAQIKPRMAAFCRMIHDHGALVRYHCCGSARAIIPDLIEIGVDILNPVQPLAEGMDPFELKARFGDRLTFHGGIDVQQLLPNGTADQVRRHVRRMIDVVGRDGGYILGGSHVIQADVPVANVLAMLEEAMTPGMP